MYICILYRVAKTHGIADYKREILSKRKKQLVKNVKSVAVCVAVCSHSVCCSVCCSVCGTGILYSSYSREHCQCVLQCVLQCVVTVCVAVCVAVSVASVCCSVCCRVCCMQLHNIPVSHTLLRVFTNCFFLFYGFFFIVVR